MNKTEVCMFCRYRRTRAGTGGAGACCPAEEVLNTGPQAGERPVQGRARAMPERLRTPARPPQPIR
jgi:hypothetical protein